MARPVPAAPRRPAEAGKSGASDGSGPVADVLTLGPTCENIIFTSRLDRLRNGGERDDRLTTASSDDNGAGVAVSSFKNPAWLPFSVSEAASAGEATGHALDSGEAWNHLLDTLKRTGDVVLSDGVPSDPVDMASGFRHLLVLLGVGIDELLRRGLDRVPTVKPSGMDAAYKWGMECPDCIYVGSALRGDTTYRLWGTRGSARYVGLQVMSGMGSTANALLDEFDLGPDGEFEIILSAEPHEGNWLPLDSGATMLVVRHFFYDWEHEVPVTMTIEPLSGPVAAEARPSADPKAVMARQVIALGDFVEENLKFFLEFSNPEKPNTFLPPLDGTAMGAAAENRPVIGSWRLAPDEVLVIEFTPPEGVYWSLSLGNVWWRRSTTATTSRASTASRRRWTGTGRSERSWPMTTPGYPTGWTPLGTARGRSSFVASGPMRRRFRPPGWCPLTTWTTNCRPTRDGCRRASGLRPSTSAARP